MAMKYSLDKSVAFDSVSHTYTKNGKKLTSVTSFISKFKNEFDSEYWSKKIALRDGKSQEQVLKEWSDKGKKSCEIGTAIHKIFEDYIDGKYSILNDAVFVDFMELDESYLEDFIPKSKVALSFVKDFFQSKRLIPVYTEYIVHNHFLAGQVDLICKDKDGNFYILDFKTNEKVEKENYGKYLKDALKVIPDSTYYHYCLQLSIYKKMFSEPVKNIYLVHIKKDKYDFIKCDDVFEKFKIEFNDLFTV